MTISISESAHGSSPPHVTTPRLGLENSDLKETTLLASSDDSNALEISSATLILVPEQRSAEEQPVTTSSSSSSANEKRTRRRARSSFGGTEDFVKALDFAARASSYPEEENNPDFSVSISKGHNSNGCGRASVQFPTFPKRTAPAKEKQGIGKSGAGSFRTVSKLERSLSDTASTRRNASRILPVSDTSLPQLTSCRTQCNLTNCRNIEVGQLVGEQEMMVRQEEEACEPPTVDGQPSETSTAASILDQRYAPQLQAIEPILLQKPDDSLVQEQQDIATTSDSAPDAAAENLKQAETQVWLPKSIGQDNAEKELMITMQNTLSFHSEACDEMQMEEKLTDTFDSDQTESSNAQEFSSSGVILVELAASSVMCEQSSSSSHAHQEEATTTVVDVELVEPQRIALEGSLNPELQKSNERLGANQAVVTETCRDEPSLSCPTLSLLLEPETLNIVNSLLLEDSSSEANGGQNIDMTTGSVLEQQERPESSYPEENEARTPSAAEEDSLDFRALDHAHEKLSATADKHSSSQCITSSAPVESSSFEEPRVSGPGANEETLSIHTQFNPFIAEKVTEEQLTEAAFLSSLDYCSQGKAPGGASTEDLQYLCASSTNRMNAFRSKSTGRHDDVKVAVGEAAGLTRAHSDSEKEARSTTIVHPLQLHPQTFLSKFNKVELDASRSSDLDITVTSLLLGSHGLSEKKLADDNSVTVSEEAFRSPTGKVRQCLHEGTPHSRKDSELHTTNSDAICMPAPVTRVMTLVKQDAGAAVVAALKSEKIWTSQTPTLLDSSAFPRGVVKESTVLQSERLEPRGVALHKANVDHLNLGSFDQGVQHLGVTPVITTGKIQLKSGIECKATLMDALTEWQQKRSGFMNPRFGMQAMNGNHVRKIAPALSAFDRMVTLTHEKSQSIRDLLLVSPQQSLEEFHVLPSSISILRNPSFSGSQQDRLWEEQAEAYSSGGRGTPGREDKSTAATVFLTPQPCAAAASSVSGDVKLLRSASGSLRKVGALDTTGIPTCDTCSEKGKRRGKKKGTGNPRTPLRSLLAEETEDKNFEPGHSRISGSTQGANPSIKHLVLRIKGMTSSKSSIPKSQQSSRVQHKSTFWSSCICISPVK